MSEIKRYNVGYMGLEEHPRGRFVAHGDYVAEVERLKKEILLAYSNGFKAGFDNGFRAYAGG